MNKYDAFIVHYKHNEQPQKAVFLELEKALEYAAKYHGYLGGLIEAPLANLPETYYEYD